MDADSRITVLIVDNDAWVRRGMKDILEAAPDIVVVAEAEDGDQVRSILAGEPIDIYNHGDMRRDFTYIDDLVTGIVRLIGVPPAGEAVGEMDSLSPVAPFRVVNIGNGAPVGLMGGADPELADLLSVSEEGGGAAETETLYMELRQGADPVNPEEWFAEGRD